MVYDCRSSTVKGLKMDIKLVAIILVFFAAIFTTQQASAEAIAMMPNKAGGKIILTKNDCVIKGKQYKELRQIYMFTSEGYTLEGCYGLEDETVLAVWLNGQKMRYPAENFTLVKTQKIAKGYDL